MDPRGTTPRLRRALQCSHEPWAKVAPTHTQSSGGIKWTQRDWAAWRIGERAIALVLLAAVTVAAVVVVGNDYHPAGAGRRHRGEAGGGAGAPAAGGVAQVELEASILDGSIRVKDLPAQPFGSGRFYGAWFVRTDAGDKAFLGALIDDDSIIFSHPGDGSIKFAATEFTTGPHAGSHITFDSSGRT